MSFIRSFTKGFANMMFHILYKIEIDGLENIPKEGPALLCSNHIHALDSVAYVIHFKRMIYMMAKHELFRTKFKNWFLTEMGCFPVKRGVASEEAITTAINHLKDGDLVGIFPEGTRNGLAKGIKFKKGVGLIAIKANVPIIPMGITGTFKPFTKITMHIGKPIDTSEYNSEEVNPRDIITLTNKSMEEVKKLIDK